MSFKKIRGHRKILELLTQVISTGRLAHAYVFSGPEGIGKKLTALAFSKNLLCSSGGVDSCGNCPACIQVDRGNHPDLLLVVPGEKDTITVDKIRNIKRELSRKSFAGGYKVCIIDEAEKMNIQSENALLKTLEEPTPNTIIILITGKPYSLLPTVLSRCQHFKFQPLSLADSSDLIMKKGGGDQQNALLMASLTGGSPGKALKLTIDYFKKLRESWIEYSTLSSKAEGKDALNLAEDFLDDRENVDLKLNLLRLWYRDLILHKIYGNSDFLLNKDEALEIAAQSSYLSLEQLLKALFWIEGFNQIFDYNVNPPLTMEALFMKLKAKSETALLDEGKFLR